MKLLNLELPSSLVDNLDAGRAQLRPDEAAMLSTMLTSVDGPFPAMYNEEQIVLANRLWSSKSVAVYPGRRSDVVSPGDIDPQRALIIGEAEPDSPIALDYRSDPPRVVYFGDVGSAACWIELAESYESFIGKLRSPE